MSLVQEFRDFINRGNVIDLAVAVVIGTAFKEVIDSFATDIIGGLVAAIGGKPDLSEMTFTVGDGKIFYGSFITAIINFLIIAFAVFLVVKAINSAQNLRRREQVEDEVALTEIDLLAQIRDELAAQRR
jgi:large conductance mechanosensitive channel